MGLYFALMRLTLLAFCALCFLCVVEARVRKIQPLQPVEAALVGDVLSEPSGLTFCNTTQHLYAICDHAHCNYIYEITPSGNVIQRFQFPDSLGDIETVACDDINKLIYVAEERKHMVHSFRLPNGPGSYMIEEDSENPYLIKVNSFFIEPASNDGKSGLEGMTVDTKRNIIYLANEKHPKVFYTVRPDGSVMGMSYPDFSGDLSGMDYDEKLDLIWIVSDQSERLFVTNLAGTIAYDYWDLPMQNPEGVAVDNSHDPPMIYITTDPSAASGPRYVPAIFSFAKPEIGSGLVYYDPQNPPPYPDVDCLGCSTVYAAVEEQSEEYRHQKRHMRIVISCSVILPTLGGLFVGLAMIGGYIVYRKRYEHDLPTGPTPRWMRWLRKIPHPFSTDNDEADSELFDY